MRSSEKLTFRAGFTIVELLTVMGVIAILISLLVPALNLVQDYARDVQQRAQFHSIDVAIGLYKTEFGVLPPSVSNNDPEVTSGPVDPGLGFDTAPYTGANKLAEALVGLDFLGVHPKTGFRSDGVNRYINNIGVSQVGLIYDADNGIVNLEEDGIENVQARKGPFIELENANAYEMQDVYTDLTTITFEPDNLVLCDVYAKKRSSGKKTGMPILYYRARTRFTQQDCQDVDNIVDDIYNYYDNQDILALGPADDQTLEHPLYENGGGVDDWLNFEEKILNDQVTTINRPYKAGSYILLSAGQDGLYGTADDIFNFEKK